MISETVERKKNSAFIRDKKVFNIGLILAITFLGVLFLIFSPIFGGKNGLEYSDDLFNKLSKGSSYFIPMVQKEVQKFNGNNISVTVKLDKPEVAEKAAKVFNTAGAMVNTSGSDLKVSGDLGAILGAALKDSDAMYHNKGEEVKARYGMDEKEALKLWWTVLSKSVKELQKGKKIEEANVVTLVDMKALEPAYNYYKVEPQSVMDKAGTMTGLLLFYVAYTMWWGYAIFYMFEGIGLSMKKAKVKKEV